MNYKTKMLNICLTDECNQHCIHCYVNPRQHANVLSINDYKTIVKRFLNQGLENVHIFGGEPFLYKELKALLEFLSEYQLHISLVTNATLLKKDVLKAIKEQNIFLGITIHGERGIHDEIAQNPGSHDKVMKFIKYCVLIDIDFGIMTCINKHNMINYLIMANNLSKLGAKRYFLLYFSPIGRGNLKDLSIVNNDWLNFLEKVKIFKSNSTLEFYYEPSVIKPGDDKAHMFFEAYYCNIYDNQQIVIDAKGDMYPCILLIKNEKYYLGSALDDQLQIKPIKKTIPPDCNECELLKTNCESGCPAYYFESTDFRCKKGKYYPLCPLATYLL